MTASTAQTQISGLELHWRKIKRMDDHVLLATFRECLGKPSKGSFYKLLKDPGKMKTSHAIALARFLSSTYKDATIQPEDLIKSY